MLCMSIAINHSNFLLENKIIAFYEKSTSNLVRDLKFFQYLFSWYIELSPGTALCHHIKKSLTQIKNIRSVSSTWEFTGAVSKLSNALVDFSLMPTYTRSLKLLEHSSEAVSKSFSLLLWLEKTGVTKLVFLNKNLTHSIGAAATLISLSSYTAAAEKSLHKLFLKPRMATFYGLIYSVNRCAIEALMFVPEVHQLLPLSLKTIDLLFGVRKKGLFLRIAPKEKNPIPYLS
jgi:hypothetical protein